MSHTQSQSIEVYLRLKNTRKARHSLQNLAAAVASGVKTRQRQCGGLGKILAAGKPVRMEPLFSETITQTSPVDCLHRLCDEPVEPDLSGHLVLSFRSAAQASTAVSTLNADPNIQYAHLGSVKEIFGRVDPLRNRQWGLAAIDLFSAQQLRSYNSGADVRIGVIDTGVDLQHP
ncbi:MAG: hypothetical protein N2C12_07655, partial [Planctomycetales bacterium]